MRWVKAALLFIISAVVAVGVYGYTDNIAVPSAILFIGVIGACMSIALAGDGASGAPTGNPRAAAGATPHSAYPDRTRNPAAGVPGSAPAGYGAAAPAAPGASEWPARNADPDAAAWLPAARGR